MSEGIIAQRARFQIPATWDALASASLYGEPGIQYQIDYVKFDLFGSVCDQNMEANLYNPVLLEYAAKLVALQVIPAGADYWSSRIITITTTGTNESKTFPDRISALWKTHTRLIQEVEDMKDDVKRFLGQSLVTRRIQLPGVSTAGKVYRSTDPWLFPLEATVGAFSNLPWGVSA